METDRAILRAAAELFHARGFSTVRVDDIGTRAGVTGPAIYRHFAGKDEILATLFDEALDGLLAATVTSGPDAQSRLAGMVRAHATFVLAERELTSIWTREDHSLDPDTRRRILRRTEAYLERWTRAIADVLPTCGGAEHRAAAHAALGLLNSFAHWPRESVGVQDLPDYVARFVLAGLAATPAAETPAPPSAAAAA
ncbi:TetR/AcrR family transcriptional regulator [Patulibacter minatonensis]|uniref:TetR/AcrR family transcriptional regulator n=1 Tax=Patulibacter minatonensis TaxID=298163 RepID=UPI00047DB516|nr:TetR/AcrR family transcriptional regulator [Patulibacter minatonensis]